jgi:hypothetical protein
MTSKPVCWVDKAERGRQAHTQVGVWDKYEASSGEQNDGCIRFRVQYPRRLSSTAPVCRGAGDRSMEVNVTCKRYLISRDVARWLDGWLARAATVLWRHFI